MDMEDVSKIYPFRPVDLAPWVAEFITLVGIWMTQMPFGFVVANVAQA